ncbi:hypothetical protein F4818DRAFT_111189 [Hypoxylon cercidicola]|nr:hypothetical protein F4818DRAFT_111189 [Hypoxylon cercidicola]
MTHSDGGIEDWSFEENELERMRREFQIELSKLDKGNLDEEPSSIDRDRDIYDLWHRIVGTYSQRDMSCPEDKLPAISAVAAEFSRLSRDECLAGLWGLILKRDTGTSEGSFHERILAFSQIPANLERPSSLFEDLETIHIV